MALSACPHRPPCDACPRFGASGVARAARAALQDLADAHGLPQVAVHSGAQFGFRHRARLAIRGRRGAPKIGLFEADSHRVVHIPNCRIHHPLINEVAGTVRACLAEAQLTCYSDRAHLGVARYLQVVVERRSGTAQVVLVVNATTVEPVAAALDLIRARLGARLHSLWVNFNDQATNVILGPRFHHHCGPPCVIEDYGGAQVHYPPGAFGQSNPEVAAQIIEHLRARIPAQSRVAEFYAGVGAIGLSLLGGVSALRLNESSPQSLEGLARGIAQLAPSAQGRVQVVPGSAAHSAQMTVGCEVAIVDPPRRGLDPELARFLAAEPPEQLFYVSCDLASLLQDVTVLLACGRLRLAALTAFNLMPFTAHVETVAQFSRVKSE